MIPIREVFKGLYRLCECPGKDGNGCKTLIPIIIRTKNTFQRFARGHFQMGKIGRLSPGYKNGITENKKRGYKRILRHHHKYCDINGYVNLHRYLKELDLGYYITPGYDVHHKDRNTRNNAPENLQVLSKLDHAIEHNPKKDHCNTICLNCGSNETYIKPSGSPHWHDYKDGNICKKCYDKLISIPKRKEKRRKKVI